MKPRARIPLLLATAALASCWKSSTTSTTETTEAPPRTNDVSVELASVTLGDDCGEGWTPPPPVQTAQAPARAPAAPAATMAADMEAPAEAPAKRASGVGSRYACQQTSMQLSLVATGAAPARVRVKQVELLDAAGTLLGQLAPAAPTRWVIDRYEPWDQAIAAGQHVAASYALSSPAWHAMEGGEWAQRGKTFQLRVTLAVGSREQTVEKQAITPMMMPPPVPT